MPSLATLLTGQCSHANGAPVINAIDGSRDHVAKHLQRAGYHTGMVGKWHLGADRRLLGNAARHNAGEPVTPCE